MPSLVVEQRVTLPVTYVSVLAGTAFDIAASTSTWRIASGGDLTTFTIGDPLQLSVVQSNERSVTSVVKILVVHQYYPARGLARRLTLQRDGARLGGAGARGHRRCRRRRLCDGSRSRTLPPPLDRPRTRRASVGLALFCPGLL